MWIETLNILSALAKNKKFLENLIKGLEVQRILT